MRRALLRSNLLKLPNHQRKINHDSRINRTSAIIEREENRPVSSQEHPWQEVRTNDGRIYYWNKHTNETTAVGASRPDPWIQIATNSGTYYWNTETNQTTALGSPLPPRYGSIQQFNQQQHQPISLGSSMMTYAVLGAGMTIGMALVSAIFR